LAWLKSALGAGTHLAIFSGGGCLMRSLAIQKYSAAALATGFGAAALQILNLNFDFPLQQLKLAWTLTRVLLQL
jgi:hypothetical protein